MNSSETPINWVEKHGKKMIWRSIAILILATTVFSTYDIWTKSTNAFEDHPCILLAVIGLLDLYLVVVLFASSLRSSAGYKHKRWVKKLIMLFPSRPMSFILLLIFLATNAGIFSSLYFSKRNEFRHDCVPIITKADARYFSFGTMAAGSIVDFTAETESAKQLKAFQIGSDILLLLGGFSLLVSRISTFENDKRQDNYSLLPFNVNFKDKTFTNEKVQRLTGYSFEAWCAFSGVLPDPVPEIPIISSDFELAGKYPLLTLKLNKNKAPHHLNFSFDLKNELINILDFTLAGGTSRMVIKAFYNLLQLAIKANFNTVQYNINGKSYKDYLLWRKFGFLVQEPPDFRVTMGEDKTDIDSLEELLKTEEGFKIWIGKVQHCNIVFDLSPDSRSESEWNRYLKKVQQGTEAID